MALVNYYDLVEDNIDPYYNPNSCLGMPLHPFKLMIVGTSGNNNKPGKTNLLLNIIDKCNNFERFYIFAKMLNNDKLYDDVLIKKLKHAESKTKTNILTISSNSLDNLPEIEHIDEN